MTETTDKPKTKVTIAYEMVDALNITGIIHGLTYRNLKENETKELTKEQMKERDSQATFKRVIVSEAPHMVHNLFGKNKTHAARIVSALFRSVNDHDMNLGKTVERIGVDEHVKRTGNLALVTLAEIAHKLDEDHGTTILGQNIHKRIDTYIRPKNG